METVIGFIGGGNMATSLIGGLRSNQPANGDRTRIIVYEPNRDKAEEIESLYDVKIAGNNTDLVAQADVVVIAVKPQVLRSILEPLAQAFARSRPLIVSVVAGIQAASINKWLAGEFAIVRVMPNTPALVSVGASGLFANSQVSAAQRQHAEAMMNAVGVTAWVEDEADIDSVTALSGSGPAYFMLFIQGLVDAAVAAGLPPDVALRLATQTAAGAARLIEQSDKPLKTLIDNVTSPGGTTEQALKSLHQSDLSGAAHKAFEAARRRSQELADELG